jgi:chitin disaccharide deacetylase
MEPRRLLIVNADDFGLSHGVNRGIVEAHEHGIVTSASLLVNARAAGEAAVYGREHTRLSVGLHVDLGPARRRWLRRARARRGEVSPERAAAALERQLARFRRLVGRDPTHLDSHHHVHRVAALRPIFVDAADRLGVPLRHVDPEVRFRGDFYGHTAEGRPEPDAITPEALIRLLEQLPDGIVELGCHPGFPDGLKAWYRHERAQEVRSLCDPRVRAAVERLGLHLVSFVEVPRRRSTSATPTDASFSAT